MPGQFELSLGDLSGQFTPYTLNHNLLGLVGWRNFSIGPAGTARITTVVGPRSEPGGGFRFDGMVSGVRLATEDLRDLGPVIEEMGVGLNLVRSHQGRKSRGTYESNLVTSIDTTLRFRNGLGVMAEFANSSTKKGVKKTEGRALLLRGAYRLGPVRWLADYEQVTTSFRTLSGSAVGDQERTNLWLRYRPNDWLSANANFMRVRSLDRDSKGYLTAMSVPRYGISISPFYPILNGGFLRNLTVDAMLRYNLRASDDLPRTIDKKYRTLTLSLIQRMGDFDLILSRDTDRDLDFAPGGVSRRGHATDLSLRWRPEGGMPLMFWPGGGVRRYPFRR